MPKAWGRVARCEMDVRPAGCSASTSSWATAGSAQPWLRAGCCPHGAIGVDVHAVPGYRRRSLTTFDHSHHDDEGRGDGTRYVFTALHRSEADLKTNMESGFYQGTEMPSISSWSTCSR